uniref:Ovule protein n=1 Tax=Heterorhabditis bacteriophora TaxID=37862 RepID=A0A1I7XFV0_HETBA
MFIIICFYSHYKLPIIRAIDIDKKLFYIITPLPPSELNRITIFARGTDILLPHQVFTSQTATNVPYLSRPSLESRSSLIADLYGALRNVGQHKRGYFPQVA